MPIVQVQTKSVSGSGASLAVSLNTAVTIGNRVIVTAAAHASEPITGSIGLDNLGNSYSNDFNTSATANPDFKRIDIFSAKVVFAGFCTVTYSVAGGSASGIALTIYEYSGLYSGANFPGGGFVPAQLGAAFIDHGAAEGSAPFPPLVLAFAFDVPELAAYYGNKLGLLGIIGAYDRVLTSSNQTYPATQTSVTVPFPSFTVFDVAVGVIVLYVGSAQVGTLDCSIQIAQNCGPVPFGTVGSPYNYTFPAGSGNPPFTYAVSAGSLPPGLVLNASTGVVSGTPTTAGIFNFTMSITDSTCNVGGNTQCIVVTTIMQGQPG